MNEDADVSKLCMKVQDCGVGHDGESSSIRLNSFLTKFSKKSAKMIDKCLIFSYRAKGEPFPPRLLAEKAIRASA